MAIRAILTELASYINAAGTSRGALTVAAAISVDTLQLDATNKDIVLSRGAANRLDLASGDSFKIVSGSLVMGATDLSETDLAKIDGITNGAGAANKALVLDANADIASGLRTAVLTLPAVGSTTTAALTLLNSSAAANGAQQYSPSLSLIGYGWKTDTTAASQAVEVRWEVRPVQGSSAPTYQLALLGRVGAGAWTDLETINSAGSLFTTNSHRIGATGMFWWDTRAVLQSPADGVLEATDYAGTAKSVTTVSLTGGVAISSHAISLAQDATTKVGTAPVGILTVVNVTDSAVAQFSLIGTGVVAELHDSSGNFTITKDNAATINVYYNTDGVYVQNKIAATKSVRLILEGV